MRIKLRLDASTPSGLLPFDYAYALTALIYRTLEVSSSTYSAFLHDQGYHLPDKGKPFKLFTFSQLQPERYRVEPGGLRLLTAAITWQISSPMIEFVEHLADGLLRRGRVELSLGSLQLPLEVSSVETLAAPVFSERMAFKCLSPLVATTKREHNGKLSTHYYRHDDPALPEALRQNLIRKYRLIHGYEPEHTDFILRFDSDYVRKKNSDIYKLVQYRARGQVTQIKGILAPFVAGGSPELIQAGYEAGFGEKNSMGFGMAEILC
jgi:CRISPR-associated endoribonuclease Cas6